MLAWNAVATVREDHYAEARRALDALGRVGPTHYYNVLVVRLDEPEEALETWRALSALEPEADTAVAHLAPLTHCWDFDSAERFEAGARTAVRAITPALAGRSFHVRMHRRGFKGRIDSHAMEKLLAEQVLAELEAAGTPARVDFDDPDAVVAIETVGQRAGLLLWTRQDRQRYPFLPPG